MTELAPPSPTGFVPVVINHRRIRLRRVRQTLFWLGLTTAVIVAILFAPHILHAIHPGPTGGGG